MKLFPSPSRWFVILLVILCQGYYTAGLAASKTILVYGDSLSAGYGLNRGEEWPALLQHRILGLNSEYEVVNHSISGETTSGGLARLPDSLDLTTPDIVILELGANDGLRGLSMKQMRLNLQRMIDLSRDSGARVILVGMYLPENYGKPFNELFHRQFEQLAKKNNLNFVPFLMDKLGIGMEMYQSDGLHPTADAQPQIMENVWQILMPLIEE